MEHHLLFHYFFLMEQIKPYGSSPWKEKLYQTIFQTNTRAGKLFNAVLLLFIIISVTIVALESVYSVRIKYHNYFITAEWIFTILFTAEYILRLLCLIRPMKYAFSLFGIIDFIAIIPTYLTLIFSGQTFLVVRILRLLRIFRILKLPEYTYEATVLFEALKASSRKILVFLFSISVLVVIIGTLIYVVEGPENGYTDIPTSMYWVIVTITTVGFGDIAPRTPFGKFLASVTMLLGYGIIAVPTGIVSVEIARAPGKQKPARTCPSCGKNNHEADAVFCRYCGSKL